MWVRLTYATGYVNSLLAALSDFSVTISTRLMFGPGVNRLNSRGSLREKANPQDGTFLQLSPFRALTSQPDGEESFLQIGIKRPRTGLAVNVHTQTISKIDSLDSVGSSWSCPESEADKAIHSLRVSQVLLQLAQDHSATFFWLEAARPNFIHIRFFWGIPRVGPRRFV